jgi:proteasome accessory factor C
MLETSKSVVLERTARLLNLVPYLLVHQGIAIEKLSNEFGVSESQILEDLNTLWMCGLPGYTPLELIDLSFDSGFVTIWNAETLQQPRTLNRDEALTLVLGLGYLLDEVKDLDSDLSAALQGLIGKLTSSFDAVQLRNVHAGTPTSSRVRGLLDKAITDRGIVVISYHSMARDLVTERTVHPLEFRVDDEVEYFFAYCELSAGYRTFRLDRILSITSTQSAGRSTHTDAPTQERSIHAELVVESRFRDAFERFRVPFQDSQRDGFQRITIEGFSSDWLVREIMSFGGEIRLVSPTAERNLVRQRSERALSAYRTAPVIQIEDILG